MSETNDPVSGAPTFGFEKFKGSDLLIFRIIWTGLLITQFMHVFVAFNKGESTRPRVEWFAPGDSVQIPLIVISVVMLLAAILVPKLMASSMKQGAQRDAETGEITNAPQLYLAPFIIRLALLESITLFGLVMVFLTSDPAKILPFTVVTVISFLLCFPTASKIKAAVSG